MLFWIPVQKSKSKSLDFRRICQVNVYMLWLLRFISLGETPVCKLLIVLCCLSLYLANICLTKEDSHFNTDLTETIEGVNMTFPPVPKQRLGLPQSNILPKALWMFIPTPSPPVVHASFTCTALLWWHHNAWAVSDTGMERLLLFEAQLNGPQGGYIEYWISVHFF